ncbi:MAG: AIR synthase-related protein, partial [Pseudomonadota bacterium]|nr:AIR synthase-related protein [Pseudomonadota bacterium]
NCSLYNETNGNPINPAPVIGGVGLIEDVSLAVSPAFKGDDESLFVIGATQGHIGQSLYLREIHGKEEGAPPPVDLTAERKHGEFVRGLIGERLLTSCHDVADGGLLIALAEMALAGDRGCVLDAAERDQGFWFGEDQGRYVIATEAPDEVERKAKEAGVPLKRLGRTGGVAIRLGSGLDGGQADTASTAGVLELAALRKAHEAWLPDFMGS